MKKKIWKKFLKKTFKKTNCKNKKINKIKIFHYVTRVKSEVNNDQFLSLWKETPHYWPQGEKLVITDFWRHVSLKNATSIPVFKEQKRLFMQLMENCFKILWAKWNSLSKDFWDRWVQIWPQKLKVRIINNKADPEGFRSRWIQTLQYFNEFSKFWSAQLKPISKSFKFLGPHSNSMILKTFINHKKRKITIIRSNLH